MLELLTQFENTYYTLIKIFCFCQKKGWAMSKNMLLRAMLVVFLTLCGSICAESSAEIGIEQVMRIKRELKEPLLTLLASSEFIDMGELSRRLDMSETSIKTFKEGLGSKRVESTPSAPAPVVEPVAMPVAPAVLSDQVPVMQAPVVEMPVAAPVSMPVAAPVEVMSQAPIEVAPAPTMPQEVVAAPIATPAPAAIASGMPVA